MKNGTLICDQCGVVTVIRVDYISLYIGWEVCSKLLWRSGGAVITIKEWDDESSLQHTFSCTDTFIVIIQFLHFCIFLVLPYQAWTTRLCDPFFHLLLLLSAVYTFLWRPLETLEKNTHVRHLLLLVSLAAFTHKFHANSGWVRVSAV